MPHILAHHSPHRVKLRYQACSLQEDSNVFTPLFFQTSCLPPSWGLLIRLIPPTADDAKGLGACPDSLTGLVGQGGGARPAVGYPALPERMRSTHRGQRWAFAFDPPPSAQGDGKCSAQKDLGITLPLHLPEKKTGIQGHEVTWPRSFRQQMERGSNCQFFRPSNCLTDTQVWGARNTGTEERAHSLERMRSMACEHDSGKFKRQTFGCVIAPRTCNIQVTEAKLTSCKEATPQWDGPQGWVVRGPQGSRVRWLPTGDGQEADPALGLSQLWDVPFSLVWMFHFPWPPF